MSTAAFHISSLLEKMTSSDKDFRFMATSDLMSELQKDSIQLDEDSERKVVKMLLRLLEDKNGEVQNLAVKCLGPLVGKVKEYQVETIVDVLCANMRSDKEQLRDIAGIGLKTVLSELPTAATGSSLASNVCRKITGQLTSAIAQQEDVAVQLEALDILSDMLSRLGAPLGAFHASLLHCLLPQLSSPRLAVRKRAVGALGHLAAACSTDLFVELADHLLDQLPGPRAPASPTAIRTLIQCLGSIGRQAGHRLGAHLDRLVPLVEEFCNLDDDELRESCLQAFEAFLRKCPKEMGPHVPNVTSLCLQYVKHDPNYNYDSDEDEEQMEAEPRRQYLLLHSLREALGAAQPDSLKPYAEDIWALLFQRCEGAEEGTRGVVAECIGKLVLVNPPFLLPRFRKQLAAGRPHTRCTVITAVKYLISDQPHPIDPLLKTFIGEFMESLQDPDLNVRRATLAFFNSAVHNKPSLVRDLLDDILPFLYQETKIRRDLIREVEMGPFKHTVDDGLDVRKAAFECMYSLLESCLGQLDVCEFLNHVEDGLKDHYDIRMLTFIMLARLATLCPVPVLQRVDRLIEPLRATCTAKVKAGSVKQEFEKQDELKRSAMRAVAALLTIPEVGKSPIMADFSSQIRSNPELAALFESIQKDSVSAPSTDSMELS